MNKIFKILATFSIVCFLAPAIYAQDDIRTQGRPKDRVKIELRGLNMRDWNVCSYLVSFCCPNEKYVAAMDGFYRDPESGDYTLNIEGREVPRFSTKVEVVFELYAPESGTIYSLWCERYVPGYPDPLIFYGREFEGFLFESDPITPPGTNPD